MSAKKSSLVLVSILAGLAFAAQAAAQPVKVVTFPIPLMVESADKGVFIELVKLLGARAGKQLDIQVLPTKRAVETFLSGQADCFLPALDVMFPSPVEASSEMYSKIDFAFVRKGDKVPKTIAELEGKTVGITLGYPYVKELTDNPKIKIEVSESDVVNMKKLASGRIDLFVVEEQSGKTAMTESGVEGIVYDPASPLSSQKVYLAFQKNAAGKLLAGQFSAALAAIMKDGNFAAIMSKAK